MSQVLVLFSATFIFFQYCLREDHNLRGSKTTVPRAVGRRFPAPWDNVEAERHQLRGWGSTSATLWQCCLENNPRKASSKSANLIDRSKHPNFAVRMSVYPNVESSGYGDVGIAMLLPAALTQKGFRNRHSDRFTAARVIRQHQEFSRLRKIITRAHQPFFYSTIVFYTVFGSARSRQRIHHSDSARLDRCLGVSATTNGRTEFTVQPSFALCTKQSMR